jgi:hypothetical protein
MVIEAWPASAWTRLGFAIACAQIVMQACRASCSETGIRSAASHLLRAHWRLCVRRATSKPDRAALAYV